MHIWVAMFSRCSLLCAWIFKTFKRKRQFTRGAK